MRICLHLLLLSALALAAGCESLRDHATNARLDRQRAAALAAIDQDACRARGGEIRGFGMFGTPVCAVAFSDAGKACTDKADCEGMCLLNDSDLPEGSPSSGQCQQDDHPDGCWLEIVGGKTAGGWCLD